MCWRKSSRLLDEACWVKWFPGVAVCVLSVLAVVDPCVDAEIDGGNAMTKTA